MPAPLLTIIETREYLSRAEKRLSAEERAAVVEMIAADPECGDLIQGGGGIRKVRVAIGGRGKSGGAGVVYYFHARRIPVFLLTVFAKNEKANLTKAERNALAAAKTLARTYGA